MRVAVTGGTGFVGSHAVEALVQTGARVRLLARDAEKVRNVLGVRGVEVEDVRIVDMRDAEGSRSALKGCDAVLHAAALVEIGLRSDAQAANAEGNRNILGAACELGLDPIVYISSVAALFPPRGPVMRPSDPIGELTSSYGRSKTEGERYARELQEAGQPVTIVYPAGVYGPDDPGLGAGARGLRDRLRFGWPLSTGGNACIDVRDLATLLARSMEAGRGPRRYMAGGHFLPWAEEADLCEELTGRGVRRIRASPAMLHRAGALVDWLQKHIPGFDYPLTKEAAHFVTDSVACDSSETLRDLGIVFRPSAETLGDAIRWLVRAGHLNPRYAGRLGTEPGSQA